MNPREIRHFQILKIFFIKINKRRTNLYTKIKYITTFVFLKKERKNATTIVMFMFFVLLNH